MITTSPRSLVLDCLEYGEDETAAWVPQSSDDEYLRIATVSHWILYHGPGTPSGNPMRIDKALVLAAVYVHEGAPRELLRGRRRRVAPEAVEHVSRELRAVDPQFRGGPRVPRDYGLSDEARAYWLERAKAAQEQATASTKAAGSEVKQRRQRPVERYELVFWKGPVTNDPADVWERLQAGPVPAVTTLSRAEVEDAFRGALAGGWKHVGPGAWRPTRSAPGSSALARVAIKHQYVLVVCEALSGLRKNQLIDAMLGIDLRLYDPQIKERFDRF